MARRPATVPPIKPPAVLPDTVPACHELIQQLLQDLDVLRERFNLNSSNSSKPPSSDGPGTPPRTVKAQSGKRPGGQPGHKGSFRAPLPEDKLTGKVLCPPPPQCTACGCAVRADGDKPIRHQVFELPRIEPLVTEYVRLRGGSAVAADKSTTAPCLWVCPTGNWAPVHWPWWGRWPGSFT
jgi:hypothetical protein